MNKPKTKAKLKTPFKSNKEEAKKRAELNSARSDTYEFGNEVHTSAKDSALARGANIANAFSQANAASAENTSEVGNFGKYNEEYALGASDNIALDRQINAKRRKQRYQDNLRRNLNVEFSDDELIKDDNCRDKS